MQPSHSAPHPSIAAESAAPLGRLALVSAILLLGFLTTGIPLTALPLFIHDHLALGSVAVGIAIATQAVAALVTRAKAGAIVDRHGGRRAAMLGLGLAIVAGGTYPLAALMTGSSSLAFAMLLCGRVLLGSAESLLVSGILGWGIALMGPQRTGQVMVWVGIALFAALGLGSPLGLWLYQTWGLSFLLLGSAAVASLALALAAALAAPPITQGTRIPFYRVIGLVWKPGLGLAAATVGFAVLCAFGGLHFVAHGWAHATWLIPCFTLAYIGPRLFLSQLPDRLGGAQTACACLIIEAIGLSVLASAPGPWLSLIGAGLTGLGFSLVFPSFGREAVLHVPPASRGSAVSAYVAFFDLALGVTGPVAGVIAAQVGYAGAFLFGALACLIALGIALQLRRKMHT